MSTRKKRYRYWEVVELMKKKYGDSAPYICETNNHEPEMKYHVEMVHYQTLLEIVDKYKLDELD